MKPVFLFVACVFGSMTPAIGQLIHLTVDGVVTDKFGGDSWWSGDGSGVGEAATLHLYYDPQLSVAIAEPWLPSRSYRSNSAANNFWRLEFGHVDIAAPFETIDISDTELSLHYFSEARGFTTLDLRLVFGADPSPGFALPVPPFPNLAAADPALPFGMYPSAFMFDTLDGFELDEGSLFVGVERLRAETVARFQPVPEPGAFAIAGAMLLVAAIGWRR
jgi:hypothetical protein